MNDGKIILSIKVSEYIVQAQSIINQFITTLLLIKKKKNPTIWRIFLQLGNSRPKHVFVMFPEFSLQ